MFNCSAFPPLNPYLSWKFPGGGLELSWVHVWQVYNQVLDEICMVPLGSGQFPSSIYFLLTESPALSTGIVMCGQPFKGISTFLMATDSSFCVTYTTETAEAWETAHWRCCVGSWHLGHWWRLWKPVCLCKMLLFWWLYQPSWRVWWSWKKCSIVVHLSCHCINHVWGCIWWSWKKRNVGIFTVVTG